MTTTIRLPDGWYRIMDHRGQQSHWFEHISGARLLVMDGTIPNHEMTPGVALTCSETPDACAAEKGAQDVLNRAGFTLSIKTQRTLIFDWPHPVCPPVLDASRDFPPFKVGWPVSAGVLPVRTGR